MIIQYFALLFAWVAINLVGVMFVSIAILLFILGGVIDSGFRVGEFIRKNLVVRFAHSRFDGNASAAADVPQREVRR